MNIKKLLAGVIINNLPKLLKFVANSPSKWGGAVKEVTEAVEVIKTCAKDKVIDSKDLEKIFPELIEGVVAVMKLANKDLEIKLKK